MALKLVDGKEIRVPGGAIHGWQRRGGLLGKLDGINLSEFRRMPLCDQLVALKEAKAEKKHKNIIDSQPLTDWERRHLHSWGFDSII